MPNRPRFLFATCQIGAENALKAELAVNHPAFRPAFARPGFLTFKLPADFSGESEFLLRSVFARSWGFTLGKLAGEDGKALSREAWSLAEEQDACALHVWQRDTVGPAAREFGPTQTPLSALVRETLCRAAPAALRQREEILAPDHQPKAGETVLDCIIVEPGEWWLGYHYARSVPSRWSGGLWSDPLPEHAVSRAYQKMQEALAWSRLPIAPKMICAEIGCAPGGASQALLEHGLVVIGIDPADVDPLVLAHPNFRHLKMRSKDVPRRELFGVRWLTADVNVAPSYTLDTVEAIVSHPRIAIRGMLLTLKLLDWNLAEEIPHYLARVRSWGYRHVQARQLSQNRQEVYVAALRHRSLLRMKSREPRRRKTGNGRTPADG